MEEPVITSTAEVTPAPAPEAPTTVMPSPGATNVSAGIPSQGPKAGPTRIDPNDYALREDYAKALLDEKLGQLQPGRTENSADPIRSNDGSPQPEVPPTGSAADQPDPEEAHARSSEAEPAPDSKDPTASSIDEKEQERASEDPVFELEPDPAITPEGLSRSVKENAELARLLDSDPRLKGKLYKAAREAAELAPYREIFPDVESARSAQETVAIFNDVRESFLGSTTREGTLAALTKIAELSYERNQDGSVLMHNGQPVIGQDFFSFIRNVASLDLDQRVEEVQDRLKSNFYRSPIERERDEAVKAALDILREEAAAPSPAKEDWPERLRLKQEELDRQEKELNRRRYGVNLEQRESFEKNLQQDAFKRIHGGIERILSNVEKQGALISPYLKNILPQAIGAKLIAKVQANPTLQAQMRELQRLPPGEQSRQRRLSAVDRAIQQFLPQVAREELREAGVQIANASVAKRAKVAAQLDTTRQTEPKGSTGPAGTGKPLSANAAFDHAQAEWKAANPGRPFDSAAKEQILPRVLQLMSAR